MNTKFICIAVCTFLSCTGFSQQTNIDVENVTRVTFLSPGISYEHRIGKMQTLYGHALLNVSAYYSYSDYFGSRSAIDLDPGFTLQYRYYYNAKARSAKGKRTEKNNLNYLAPVWETVFTKGEINSGLYERQRRRAIHSTGAVWGLQRNYPKRFSLDLNVGLGYVFGKELIYDNSGQYRTVNSSAFTVISHFSIGFWLGKR
jgi:hypothetical protein